MFVLIKPWTFRNEWCTISCSEYVILFFVDLVKGKDAPAERPSPKIFREREKCVLNVAPKKNTTQHREDYCARLWFLCSSGIGGYALIKNIRYWPHYIYGGK